MQSSKKFGTAFNCMDGRCQEAVRKFVCDSAGVQYVDMINEPGVDGILAGKIVDKTQPSNGIEWLQFKADVSHTGHGSRFAVVVGHEGCAGNNVSKAEHVADIQKATEKVRSWGMFDEVTGLFSAPNELGEWRVEVCTNTEQQTAA